METGQNFNAENFVQQARNAGYSDDEINQYMQQKNLGTIPTTMSSQGLTIPTPTPTSSNTPSTNASSSNNTGTFNTNGFVQDARKAGYSDAEIQNYMQKNNLGGIPVSQMSFMGALGNAGNDIVNLVKGLFDPNSPLQKLGFNPSDITNPVQSIENKIKATGQIGSGILNEYSQATGIGQNGKVFDPGEAWQHFYTHPVNTIMDLLPFIPAATKAVSGLRVAATPEEGIVSAITDTQDAAANAGRIPQQNIMKIFGTYKNPSADLYDGLGNASTTQKLKSVTQNEIANLLDVSQPKTYADLLQLRQGYLNEVQSAGSSAMRQLNQNFADATTKLLHEDIPQISKNDSIVQELQQVKAENDARVAMAKNKVGAHIQLRNYLLRNAARIPENIIGYGLGYGLMNKVMQLFNNLTPSAQQQQQQQTAQQGYYNSNVPNPNFPTFGHSYSHASIP